MYNTTYIPDTALLSAKGRSPEVIKMALGKKLLIAIVAVVIIVIICIAAGIIVLNKDNKKEDTYWYYIDYGAYETSTATNGWISAESGNALDGLNQALSDAGVINTNDISSNGWINTINGVTPDSNNGESWYTWAWSGSTWTELTDTLGNVDGTLFYIGVTGYTVGPAPDYVTTIEIDPNVTTGWQGEGPFAQ